MFKTTVNEAFFKQWSRESAWVYGWLLTDGSITPRDGQIRLHLKHIDKDVLIKIRRALNFSGNIYYNRTEDGRESYYIRICRKSMVEDLSNLGMPLTEKSFNTNYPDSLPEELFWDFMRGVMEGDGCLKHGKRWNDLTVYIASASPQFLPAIQDKLLNYGIKTTISTRRPGVSGNKHELYTLCTKSNADALRWCFFMYSNTDERFRLDRKFEIFRNYVKGYYDRKRRSLPCIEMIKRICTEIPECSAFAGAA